MNSEQTNIFRKCRMMAEEKKVKAVVQPNIDAYLATAVGTGLIPLFLAALMRKFPVLRVPPGMNVVGTSTSLFVYGMFRPTKERCVSIIMRDELTDSQQLEFVESVAPLFADIDINIHYLLTTQLDRKCLIIQKIQSFLTEKLGYKEFTSTLPKYD